MPNHHGSVEVSVDVFAEFAGALVRQAPRGLPSGQMQWWRDRQGMLAPALSAALDVVVPSSELIPVRIDRSVPFLKRLMRVPNATIEPLLKAYEPQLLGDRQVDSLQVFRVTRGAATLSEVGESLARFGCRVATTEEGVDFATTYPPLYREHGLVVPGDQLEKGPLPKARGMLVIQSHSNQQVLRVVCGFDYDSGFHQGGSVLAAYDR